MRNQESLQAGLQELGLQADEKQLNHFDRFYELLIEWNEKMNLTAITDYEEFVKKHLIDSLSLVKIYNLQEKEGTGERIRILDMGTGAGFPGIPLRIMFQRAEFVLMDSLNKRITFINEVIRMLGLTGITAIHARAEEYGRKAEYREQFDLCVSRAVARLNSLTEYCLPFVKEGGYFIPYKSGRIQEELEEADYAITKLGGRRMKEETFLLPGSDIERTLIAIRKIRQTPAGYPRAGGKPLKAPLKIEKKS